MESVDSVLRRYDIPYRRRPLHIHMVSMPTCAFLFSLTISGESSALKGFHLLYMR